MSDNVEIIKIDNPYLELDCGLGEAPHWEEDTNTLRFLDVVKRRVHYVDVGKGPESHRFHQMDYSIGITGDIEGDPERFVFGGKHGFGIANRKTGAWKYIKRAWSEEEINEGNDLFFRANDGGIDPLGNFWVSFMHDALVKDAFQDPPQGFVLRLTPSLELSKPITSLKIPNGTRWSPDGRTFYFADSPFGTISAWDFDLSTGTISNKRLFYTVPKDDLPGMAGPDGFCVDTEGNLWIAVWGRGKIAKVSPEGKLLKEVHLPTRCATCPCFVGEDLYVTSMPDGNPGEGPEVERSRKLAGSLFKIPNTGARGVPLHKFKPSVPLPKV